MCIIETVSRIGEALERRVKFELVDAGFMENSRERNVRAAQETLGASCAHCQFGTGRKLIGHVAQVIAVEERKTF